MLKLSLTRYISIYPVLGLLGAYAHFLKVPLSSTSTLSSVPICNSTIYCTGRILQTIQIARIFNDSKTYVDLKLKYSDSKVIENFDKLMNETENNPTRDELRTFLDDNFENAVEVNPWTPPDFDPNPSFVNRIKDPNLRQFASNVVNIWPTLGRRVTAEVNQNPQQFSLIYIPQGFIVPGGRFKELYYWDTYWIIRGLLLCNMEKTVKGMIENFLFLVTKFGYIPNGSRIYYLGRSQPPLLTWMVFDYFAATRDVVWLRNNIVTVERELQYWLKNKVVQIEVKGIKYNILRYKVATDTSGPRPESYYEDYTNGNILRTKSEREQFYAEIKSAAESGWDFSSRWSMTVTSDSDTNFNLTNIKTSQILPVDLNAIFAGALQKMGDLKKVLRDHKSAKYWWRLAQHWRRAIEDVMWDAEDGIWYDYDIKSKSRRKNFYLSCAAPLWAAAVQPRQALDHAGRFVTYLKSTGALKFPGGVPTSLRNTGEQWDYPNAWPPLQAMLIGALENSEDIQAKRLAKEQIEIWVRANYMGYKKYHEMFEKYSSTNPGERGGGGEYIVQSGFGWTNGYVLELLYKYGDRLELKVGQ